MKSPRFDDFIVRRPAWSVGAAGERRASYMGPELVPGCRVSVEVAWIRALPAPTSRSEHAHGHDSIVLYIGGDYRDPEELGAAIEYRIGGQAITIDTTSSIYVPRGVRHGPAVWKKLDRPHLEVSIGLPPEGTGKPAAGVHIDYEQYVVRHPYYLKNTGVTDALQSPAGIYVSSDLIPGARAYIDFGWICGLPSPNPPIPEHSHGYEEVVLNIGGDPDAPETLGAEIEFCVGGEPLFFDTTAAVYAPKGVIHGPLTWKKLARPHLLMPIIIGTGSLKEAAPAGYKED
jgi:hypothetical protein